MPSTSTDSSVPRVPIPSTIAISSNSDTTGPVKPAGTNTIPTEIDTSSSVTEPLSAVPRSAKTVKNKAVTRDRKASCRDGNNTNLTIHGRSICKRLWIQNNPGGMETAFASYWEALCTSGGDKAFIDQANTK
ncbi:hypothetical protein FPV67DRAFT_1451345 [Lyophyllum atratum]|nr:hypothetical protein FPV67DRAFT_1451345 [Lyophyllum atratum]